MTPTTQPVRWGILGTARITAKVVPAMIASQHAEIAGIASRSLDKATDFAKTYSAAKTFEGYDALLQDDEIDAVYIPLPPNMHREWTIKAAEAGKHVLCEKPLGLNAAECEEMWAACKENNVQLMDGVMWYHHPRCRAMLDMVQKADTPIGELRRVTSAFTFCWHDIPENEFRTSRKFGGGSLYDLGWYNVGLTLQVLKGEIPQRVWGTARYRGDIDMNFAGIMYYDNDRIASFDCGFDTGMRKWMEVAGTHGNLVCDDFVLPWPAKSFRFWTHDEEGNAETHEVEPTNQIVHMIDDFCEVVQSGKLNDFWPQLSINTQKICDLLDQSAREERPIDVV